MEGLLHHAYERCWGSQAMMRKPSAVRFLANLLQTANLSKFAPIAELNRMFSEPCPANLTSWAGF
jgi:hypothetical protein